MGTQGASQHSYTFDALNILQDVADIVADAPGEIAAAAVELDFGNTDSNGVENIAYTKGDMIVDVTVVESATGDEAYQFVYQLSDTTGFTGVIINKGLIAVGAAGGVVDSLADDDFALGRRVISVDNEHAGTLFRFARVFNVVDGTIDTTGINALVWFAERK